jgi:hypothetical protein
LPAPVQPPPASEGDATYRRGRGSGVASSTRPGGVTGAGFRPGVSGNPAGRPAGLARRVREIVGDDGEAIATFLVEVMNDEGERTRDRLEAARLLGDRGWGKPVVSIDLDVGLEAKQMTVDTEKLAELPSHELDVLISLAERGYLRLSSPPLS